MGNIENTVSQLRSTTKTFTDKVDIYRVPYKYNLKCEQQYTYLKEGEEISNSTKRNLLLLVENPPYNYHFSKHGFEKPLSDLINNGDMRPFMLFINGKFINWSKIQVFEDCYYTYFCIDNEFVDIPQVDCILLPNDIIYNEGFKNTRVTEETFFGFTMKGLLDPEFEASYVTIDIPDVYCEQFNITNNHRLSLNPNYLINDNSIFLFNDGLYNYQNEIYNKGLNVLHSVNNKTNYCIIFSNKIQNGKSDIVNTIPNKTYISDRLLSSDTISSTLERFLERFDFKMDRNKSYEENMNNAIQYIMSYNPNLLNIHYDSSDTIEFLYFDAEEMAKKINDGYISISKFYKGSVNNNFILLQNGKLYPKYNKMYLEKGITYKIPMTLQDISSDDKFELIYFKNINNSVYDLYLSSDMESNIIPLDPDFDITKSKLYCEDIEEKEYNLKRTKFIQYEVDYEAKRVNEGDIQIRLKNGWYYDKDLYLVSDSSFHYQHIDAGTKCEQGYALSKDFVFSHNLSKYMIFINGRRVDKENYYLTIPSNTRPFTHIRLYFNIILQEGDTIDVFYLPFEMEETAIIDQAENNVVEVNRENIKYGLDKSIYMIFINGKKVKKDNIINISPTKLLLKDTDGINNISIIKYIKDDEILSSILPKTDLITDIIDSLKPIVFDKLYENSPIIPNDLGIQRNFVSQERVLYNIVSDFFNKPYVYKDDTFMYDYYITDNLLYDSAGNIVFDLNAL